MTVKILKQVFSLALMCFLTFGAYVWSGTNPNQDQRAKSSKETEEKQNKKDKEQEERQKVVLHNEIVVTATRTEKSVFDVPMPVSVLRQKKIEERSPNNVAELLPEMPGADVVGVGANQSRPVIRGLGGQRILLLTDGIRLSNSRRTQTFGEIPALTDVSTIERVEVVRGPVSVLYGSEAIGGVVNILTQVPDYDRKGTNIAGRFGYRFGSADEQHKGFASLGGNMGKFGFMLSGTYRKAQDYAAPAGSFGQITLSEDTPVLDTGVQDNTLNLFLGLRISDADDISFKYETYHAKDAGFGYVDPAVYAPGDPEIQLLYPDQTIQKFTLKYENRALRFFLADGIAVIGYHLLNTRTFDTRIGIPLFPGAELNIRSSNLTEVETLGSRLELTKVLFNKHVLTYGVDFFQDNSENTDSNTTEFFMFGRSQTTVDDLPKVPHAFFRSVGLFVQDDISLLARLSLILGLRYQYVLAQTKETPGITDPLVKSSESTLVGSANLLYDLTDKLKFVLSLGRGFRSPNLPERFFHGVTPDGGGFQVRNPDLESETSFNMDAGFRFRWNNLYFETSLFRNTLYDGIQIQPTGNRIGRLWEYSNVNVDRLRIQGAEMLGQSNFDFGLSLTANFSYLTSKNLTNPELMYADSYGSRLNINVRYTFPQNLFWIEYHIRHNGDRKDVSLGDNPIGPIIPGFTEHSLRTGVNLLQGNVFSQQIGLIIGNLTNTLYSEFSNASFFRPAPKRHIILTWITRF